MKAPGDDPGALRFSISLKICACFGCRGFMDLIPDLEHSDRNVKRHDGESAEVRETWKDIIQKTLPTPQTTAAPNGVRASLASLKH